MAAPGPSLSSEVIKKVRLTRWLHGWRVLAVQDAYRVMPWADVVYGCDTMWWDIHKDCKGFRGERWSSHEILPDAKPDEQPNDKRVHAERYGLKIVKGFNRAGFSRDPDCIHYGHNSGFQAVNLALLFGSPLIVLVGFDMRLVADKAHFFGDHPPSLRSARDPAHFDQWIEAFSRAGTPQGRRIVNATPGSALKCYPQVDLDEFISAELRRPNGGVHCHGAESHAAAG